MKSFCQFSGDTAADAAMSSAYDARGLNIKRRKNCWNFGNGGSMKPSRNLSLPRDMDIFAPVERPNTGSIRKFHV